MNIVLLCKSRNHKKVLEILAALRQQDLRFRGIVALAAASEKNTFSDLVRKALKRGKTNYARNGVMSSNGFDPALRHRRNGQLRADKTPRPRTTIAEYAKQHQIEMAVVDDLNSDACVAALKRMDTEILLLGGAPIIRANVLAVPKVCALNVHMGLLPKFRGKNVAEWSIFCNAPAGVTVHQVNTGVDTGAILYREQIDISDCPTIEKMRMKLSKQQHLILAKCTRLLIEKKLTPELQKKEDGKQYYVMHEKLKKIVEHRLSRGHKL
jgi:methionyl-tRNA formyltransferase